MMIIIDPLLTNMFTICGGEGDSDEKIQKNILDISDTIFYILSLFCSGRYTFTYF